VSDRTFTLCLAALLLLAVLAFSVSIHRLHVQLAAYSLSGAPVPMEARR